MTTTADDLEERLLAGDRRALARTITLVENGAARGREALRRLYPLTGRARTIGLTGSPGAGKSTVTNELAKAYRTRGLSVGIVAVDPSSPFTEGAILGDRVRMQELTGDPGVFMRSLATRGALGGLSAATLDVVHVLDSAGQDVILIETVGAGQDEVEIVRTAQTTVLVQPPNTGDEVQTLKAGIMEIAEVLAVNKADLAGSDRMVSALHALLSLAPASGWEPPIVQMVATEGKGVDPLREACDAHHAFLTASGELDAAERRRARQQLTTLARARLLHGLLGQTGCEARLDELSEAVAQRELDPHSAAELWVSGIGDG